MNLIPTLFGAAFIFGAVIAPIDAQATDARRSAKLVLERAIELGAPLYNRGDAAGCAAVYEVAALALANLADDQWPEDARRRLERETKDAAKEKDADDRAWALRRALDRAYEALDAHQPRRTMSATPERAEARPEAKAPEKKEEAPVTPRAAKENLIALLDTLESAYDWSSSTDFAAMVERTAQSFGDGSRAADRLRRGSLAVRLGDAREKPELRELVRELRADLLFKPQMEAKTPEGWPEPTIPGEIEIKRFPAYRMAKTAMKDGSNSTGAFWTLFNHIKSNEIPMTAPVQSDFPEGEAASMAFLYANDKVGTPGNEGDVDVITVEPLTALSIGIRGTATREKIVAAGRALETWLAGQTRWVSVGGYRTMGWTSPFVPRDRQYTEVQIEIREAGDSAKNAR